MELNVDQFRRGWSSSFEAKILELSIETMKIEFRATEHLSNIYRKSIEHLWIIHRAPKIYRKSIEHLSEIYRITNLATTLFFRTLWGQIGRPELDVHGLDA